MAWKSGGCTGWLGGLLLLAFGLQGPAAGAEDFSSLRLEGRGNEPGWSVEVARGRVTLVTGYGQHQTSAAVSAVSGGDGAAPLVVTAASQGAPLIVVREVPGLCFDTMSGAPFPYGVRVENGERSYEGCGGSTADLLTGTVWRIEDIDGRGVIDMSHLTLAFDPRGRLGGDGGCNGFAGRWEVAEGRLTAGPLRVTRRACAARALMAQETAFLTVLDETLTFAEAPGGLKLVARSGRSLILRPEDVAPQGRIQPRWRPGVFRP